MTETRSYWVLGGDARSRELAHLLAEDGYLVRTYCLGDLSEDLVGLDQAGCVVFPMPVSTKDGLLFAPLCEGEAALASILDRISPHSFLCGGRVTEAVEALFRARQLRLHDYLRREELAIANAVPTAEGALQLAMEQLPITIQDARVLVLGFGRVGMATALRFAALGAKVTVAARRCETLALAQSMGLRGLPLEELWMLPVFDVVLNTIPAPVLGPVELGKLGPDCLLLDLASAPGGVDWAAARRLGLNARSAPGLPGKVAPRTAAAAIRDTIYHMLSESEREVPIGN